MSTTERAVARPAPLPPATPTVARAGAHDRGHDLIGPAAARGALAGSVVCALVVAAAVVAVGGETSAALALGAASAATGGPFFGALVGVAGVLLRAERGV